MAINLSFSKQVKEAAAWTFLETFFATVGPAIAVSQVGNWNALLAIAASGAMAGMAAAFSVFKSNAVRNLGSPDSIFVSTPDVPAVPAAPVEEGKEVG